MLSLTMKSNIILLLSVLCGSLSVMGHNADSVSVRCPLGVSDATVNAGLRGTYVMPTNHLLRGDNPGGCRVSAGMAPFMEFSVRNAPYTRYGRWYPSAYQGVGAGLQFTLPDRVVGSSALLYAFQGATLARVSSRLTLDYEWNFGAAMGWKSYDHDASDYNREEDAVGSSATAYINLGVYLRYRLSDRLGIFGGAEITHFSNGNTSDPNPGINMLGARLGISYALGAPSPLRRADWSDFEPGMVYDIAAYGAWRRWTYNPNTDLSYDGGVMLVPGKFAVAGLCINPMYRVNPVFSAGAAIDAQYDEGANLSGNYVTTSSTEDPKFYRTSFTDRLSLGVSARVEFRMSLFAINIGLGRSVYAPGGEDLRGWYNTFSLKTFVTDRIFLLTGYRLYRFNEPGNLMLGCGYRF